MQIIGSCFIVAGLIFIAFHKVNIKKSLWPGTLHSLFGFISLIIIGIQIAIGMMKFDMLRKNNTKIYRWHGDLGLLGWDMLCVTTLLGMKSFLIFRFSSFLSYLLVICTWYTVHLQMRRKLVTQSNDVTLEMANEKEGGNVGITASSMLLCEDLDEDDKGHVSII